MGAIRCNIFFFFKKIAIATPRDTCQGAACRLRESSRGGEGEQGCAVARPHRIAAPSVFGRLHVAPIVSRFLSSHPGVRIELALSNRNLNLVEEGFDVAVRIGPLSELGLIARRVGKVYGVHAASPDYIARRGRPRTLKDLIKHDIVFVSQPRAVVNWRFRVSGRLRIVRLNPRFMVSDVDAALSVARAGGGIVRCLSYQVADDFTSGALVRLLREFERPASPVHLVAPTARRMPRVLRAFPTSPRRPLLPCRSSVNRGRRPCSSGAARSSVANP